MHILTVARKHLIKVLVSVIKEINFEKGSQSFRVYESAVSLSMDNKGGQTKGVP